MISGFLNNAVKNINHTLATFLEGISAEYDSRFSNDIQEEIQFRIATNDLEGIDSIAGSQCSTNFDISKLIPFWVVAEKSNKISSGETNVISVFDFLQKYYDWLYCDSDGGSQYGLSQNLLELIDVQKTRQEFIKKTYDLYFSSFPYQKIQNDPDLAVDLQKARDFLVSIKKTLHGRKTNKEAIRYFFNELFNISEEDIEVYFPKKDIIRLNGGRFNNEFFSFIPSNEDYNSSNSLSSVLNLSRFQDNDWFHDWSYLIYLGSTQDNQLLKEAYVESLHPAGLRLVFGKQISDYRGPGVSEETSTVCEYPMLKNYAPYGLTTSSFPKQGEWYGITLYGIAGCCGCCGDLFNGFTGPTHVLPNWVGLPEGKFFNINIVDFLQLCFDSGITSPNENATCDGC